MLGTESKRQIIDQYQRKDDDTGSTEVQVALITERIRGLTEHLRSNHHDHSNVAELPREHHWDQNSE